MNQDFMKEKPVFPLLLSMGVPMILSMILGALYNIVDSIFVSKISEDAMTALSLVYPIQNLIHAAGVAGRPTWPPPRGCSLVLFTGWC